MIPLLAAAAWAGSVGVGPALVGWQTPARHEIAPSLSIWVTHAPRPWGVTGELLGTWRVNGAASLYRYSALHLRVAGLAEWAVGTHATTFHAGAGPALALRAGSLSQGTSRVTFTEPDVGLRARVALDGPLGEHLVWAWHTGVTARLRGVDYDAGVGLGVRW